MSIEQNLSREFLRVVEEAAIAASRTMGQGQRHYSDQVAVESMRFGFTFGDQAQTFEIADLAVVNQSK